MRKGKTPAGPGGTRPAAFIETYTDVAKPTEILDVLHAVRLTLPPGQTLPEETLAFCT